MLSRELVPGDMIELKLGDIVPADAMLLEGQPVQVDQAALTGESLPVTIHSGASVRGVGLCLRPLSVLLLPPPPLLLALLQALRPSFRCNGGDGGVCGEAELVVCTPAPSCSRDMRA
jgi:hypothetical protein